MVEEFQHNGERSNERTDDRRSGGRRRGFLKSVGAGVVAATGVSTTALTASASSRSRALEPGEDDVPHEDVERIVIDDSVREVTRHWDLLTTDRDLMRERLAASRLPGSKKEDVRSFLDTVRRRYPVERVTDGNVTTVRLADAAADPSGESAEQFDQAAVAVSDGAASLHGSGDVDPVWHTRTHRLLAEISAEKMGEGGSAADTIRAHADDPDYWDPSIPGWIPGYVADYIDQVAHSYSHYRNPSLGLGSAPSNAASYVNDAQSSQSSGNTTQAQKETGWASHFIVDVGQPLHTGAEVSQFNNQWVHYDYEGWINNNWSSGENFVEVVEDTTTHYQIDDPNQSTKDLANYSHQYCATVFDTINNNPNSWKSDSNLKNVTENCLVKASQYNKGFIRYVFW